MIFITKNLAFFLENNFTPLEDCDARTVITAAKQNVLHLRLLKINKIGN
jgi:hypothetical protein